MVDRAGAFGGTLAGDQIRTGGRDIRALKGLDEWAAMALSSRFHIPEARFGFNPKMGIAGVRLHYFKDPAGNFGDDLNAWLWPRLLPDLLDDDESQLLVGIGTLLNHRLPHQAVKHVFGSGYGYGQVPVVDGSWVVHAVRGYETARLLGLARKHVITDAAVLIALVDRPRAARADRSAGYMPHAHSNGLYDWEAVCRDAGLHFIDARWPVERVLYEISRCRLLVAEAMHGAICADALRVPWVPAVAYDYISGAKWRDWLSAQELPYDPAAVPSLYDVERGTGAWPRLKSATKRRLLAMGLDGSRWTPPPPPATGPEAREQALSDLQAAAGRPGWLSADALLQQHLERYVDRLEALRRLAGPTPSVRAFSRPDLRQRVAAG
jgi:succinoglycan biosynthesis protein ExoV